MFEGRKAVVQEYANYLRAEGRPTRVSPTIGQIIRAGLEASAKYQGLTSGDKAARANLEAKILGAAKLIRAIQIGYSESVPEDLCIGAIDFEYVLLRKRTFETVPIGVREQYMTARDTGLFRDYLYHASELTDWEDHQNPLLLGIIPVGLDYSPVGYRPITGLTGAIALKLYPRREGIQLTLQSLVRPHKTA